MNSEVANESEQDQLAHGSTCRWYEQLVQQHNLLFDEQQFAIAKALDNFSAKKPWDNPVAKRLNWQWWRNRNQCNQSQKQGVYIHGSVGRGKSFLMDGFFLQVPYQHKRRLHFHRFMRHTHLTLKELAIQSEPLTHYAQQCAEEYKLLCFDEFHVNDIVDASILGALLENFLSLGICMVLTSNYHPDRLYENGLARDRFLPVIELIKLKFEVLSLDGPTDYRRRLTTSHPAFYREEQSEQAEMQAYFDKLACGVYIKERVRIGNLQLDTLGRSTGVVWFSFAQLCERPLAHLDYAKLIEQYKVIFISMQTPLAHKPDAARRFTWLIDIMYDEGAQLVLSANVHFSKLYQETDPHSMRTASRLNQMLSVKL